MMLTATTQSAPAMFELESADVHIWQEVIQQLRQEHGEATYKSWLSKLSLVTVRGGHVLLAAPTKFIREWILMHFADRIKQSWQQLDPTISLVDIVVRLTHNAPVPQHAPMASPHPVSSLNAATMREVATIAVAPTFSNDDHGPMLDSRFTFENFVVGPSNELAFAAAKSVADAERIPSGCNPLFLYGGVGLGKTHLMHAIAWHIRRTDPKRKVMYMSAEKFMYQFVRALRQKDIMSFKDQFRTVDVLMIDDIQFICGKDSTQEEFFHTFNTIIDNNKMLVVSCDRSPADLTGMEERIKSRLGWGLVADIQNTSFALRLGILRSKVEQVRAHVPDNVLDFLAHKITSNVRELEGALNKVIAHSTLVKRDITLENTQEILQDLLRSNERSFTIEDIQKRVADHYGVRLVDMSSSRRLRAVARPRQIAMYLSKQLTTRSLADIGRAFGGKDHTTVMHAIKKVESLITTDKELSEAVRLLTKLLQG